MNVFVWLGGEWVYYCNVRPEEWEACRGSFGRVFEDVEVIGW